MAAKNEMLIAGGVVALGLAYYLLFAPDADAQEISPPPPRPAIPPVVSPPGPFTPPAFVSARCPTMEADLPDDYKRQVDEALGGNWSAAEYGLAAQDFMAAGYPATAACLAAAQVNAAVKEGNFTKVPGGNSIDQTKTCAFWVQQYQHGKGLLNAAIASSIPGPSFDPDWGNKMAGATATINSAKQAIAQLGGCGIVLA